MAHRGVQAIEIVDVRSEELVVDASSRSDATCLASYTRHGKAL